MPLIGIELDNDKLFKSIDIRSLDRHGKEIFLKLKTDRIGENVSVTLSCDEVAGLRDLLTKFAEHHRI